MKNPHVVMMEALTEEQRSVLQSTCDLLDQTFRVKQRSHTYTHEIDEVINYLDRVLTFDAKVCTMPGLSEVAPDIFEKF